MYANVIIDISHEKVDRAFQYRIPEKLADQVQVGVRVRIPFGVGNHERKGYVVEITDRAEWNTEQIKEIAGVVPGSVTGQSQLIQLAWWMKERYGSTMNQALKTVLPVKQKVQKREDRLLVCRLSEKELKEAIEEAARKKYRARERLLRAFLESPRIPYGIALRQMNLTAAALKPLLEKGMVTLQVRTVERSPVEALRKIRPRTEEAERNTFGNGAEAVKRNAVRSEAAAAERNAAGYGAQTECGCGAEAAPETGHKAGICTLNPEQQAIVDDFTARYDRGDRQTSLIYGVTGSGKTEVYMELIDYVLGQGREAIVLIPEIALTYQTVLRFYRRFGDLVSVVNSRLSAGERYDQFERALNGDVRVMIGPRSALFTPFQNLGLIVIDEEHESAYKSELSPRYHAREVAQERARMSGAALVLGSATPSLEAYSRALIGSAAAAPEGGVSAGNVCAAAAPEGGVSAGIVCAAAAPEKGASAGTGYHLYRLTKRAKAGSRMAGVQVVDLREELRAGNKSIFSRTLKEAMERELAEGHQIMLFLNRRGYSNFVSCRSCGQALKCPHCDVTLTLHRNGRLVCHYCGYQIRTPEKCPSCGSPYIAGFGTGTQKIESMAREMFPAARILRMDLDTTSKKGGHEEILASFAGGEADILVGTQMIVKGHDFPNVTLVGIMAADLSLYSSDFRCGERTFQLLTQAAGRAGRDEAPGQVIIQTYSPGHYAIDCAARQDYETFYQREMVYRQVLHYPPVCELLSVLVSSRDERLLNTAVSQLHRWVLEMPEAAGIQLIGPAEAPIYKVNDIYRKILYMKQENYDILIRIKNRLEDVSGRAEWYDHVMMQFDFA